MQYPDYLHPDDIAALSNQLDLPELDSIFWNIIEFPFAYDLPELSEINEMEFARVIISKISICKSISAENSTPEDVAYHFPETSIIQSLNSCFNDYETFQIITEALPTLPEIAYYKVILIFQLHSILYEYYFNGKNENVLLRNLIRLHSEFHFASDVWGEIQYNNSHHDSIKKARSIIGSSAAAKRHFPMQRRKANAIAHFLDLNENPDTAISKNKFAEDYAEKYTVSQKTLREWLKGDLEHPYLL